MTCCAICNLFFPEPSEVKQEPIDPLMSRTNTRLSGLREKVSVSIDEFRPTVMNISSLPEIGSGGGDGLLLN